MKINLENIKVGDLLLDLTQDEAIEMIMFMDSEIADVSFTLEVIRKLCAGLEDEFGIVSGTLTKSLERNVDKL